MDKIKQRMKMQALAIIDVNVQIAKLAYDTTPFAWAINAPKMIALRMKLEAIMQTPAKLFRHDKPLLDKRKVKRSQRSAKIVRPKAEQIIEFKLNKSR